MMRRIHSLAFANPWVAFAEIRPQNASMSPTQGPLTETSRGLSEFATAARQARGWSVAHAAQRLGISDTLIRQIEAGMDKRWYQSTLNALADGYGAPREEIYRLAGREYIAGGTTVAEDERGAAVASSTLEVDDAHHLQTSGQVRPAGEVTLTVKRSAQWAESALEALRQAGFTLEAPSTMDRRRWDALIATGDGRLYPVEAKATDPVSVGTIEDVIGGAWVVRADTEDFPGVILVVPRMPKRESPAGDVVRRAVADGLIAAVVDPWDEACLDALRDILEGDRRFELEMCDPR